MIQENERNVNLYTKRYNSIMRWYIVGLGLVLLLCFYISRVPLDPDFGWHLKMGDIILSNGIPHTDTFSYTMPSYPFVDHEWLMDVSFAMLYPFGGIYGLLSIFFLFAAGSLGLMLSITKRQWAAVPFVMSALCLVPYLGIRPQIISWFFFSCLLCVVLNEMYWKRCRWGIPVLFLLWANLHGAFALGFFVLMLGLLLRSIQTKLFVKQDILIVFLSFFATFVTPYGIGIWYEVWFSMLDSSLRWSIQEWLPALFTFNLGFVFLLPLSVSLYIRYRHRFSLVEKGLFIALLLFALSSSRHIPFFALLAMPITAQGFLFFYDDIKKDKIAQRRFRLCYFVLLSILLGFSFLLVGLGIIYTKSPFASYPEKALVYLKKSPSKGNLFAEYNWGGYLIWQYPEKKVFVDGRMPSWRYTIAPRRESQNAFAEYNSFFDNESAIPVILKKYDIDTVLLSRQENAQLISVLKAIGYSPVDVKKALYRAGYKTVYSDDVSVVYRRK